MKLNAIARQLGGELFGDPDVEINDVATLAVALPGAMSLVADAKHLKEARESQASAFLVYDKLDGIANGIVVSNPRQCLPQLIELFHSPMYQPVTQTQIRPTAIYDGATLSEPLAVEHYVVIGQGTKIGEGSFIGAHSVIGQNCKVGKNCYLHPHVVIYDNVTIGDNVILHSGVVLGSDGFGFQPGPAGLVKVPHVGTVEIGANCEIMSNTNIARGCLGKTTIGDGTKLDALVQVGHNVSIGSHTVIVAQAGLAGRSHIGNQVQLGGQVGTADISIGDGSKVASKAGVTKSFPPNSVISGFPAQDHRDELKLQAYLRRQSRG